MDEPAELTAARDLHVGGQSLMKRCAELAEIVRQEIADPLSRGESPVLTHLEDIRVVSEGAQSILSEATERGLNAISATTLPELIEHLGTVIKSESWASIQNECRPHLERVLRIGHKSGETPPFIHQLHARTNKCLVELSVSVQPNGTNRNWWLERCQVFRDVWQLTIEPDALNDLQAEEALSRLEQEFTKGLVSALILRRLVLHTADLPLGVGSRFDSSVVNESIAGELTKVTPLDAVEVSPPTASSEPSAPAGEPNTSLPCYSYSAQEDSAGGAAAPDMSGPFAPVNSARAADNFPQRAHHHQEGMATESALDRKRCSEIRDQVWRMIAADRLGLAYQLALCGESLAPAGLLEPPALLRAAILGPAVRASTGEVVDQLRKSIEEVQAWLPQCQDPDQHSLAIRYLVFGLALRPTLLAPGTGAHTLLQSISTLDSQSAPLGEIRRALVEFGGFNLELSPGVLKGIRDHAVWQQQIQDLREEARAWLESNRRANIIYAPTTDVWRRWLEHDQPLGLALELVIGHQVNRADEVRQIVRHWTDQKNVEKELARTDQVIRKIGARRRPIGARARTAICARMQEFINLAQRWMNLFIAEPCSPEDFRQQRADACRSVVQRFIPAALLDVAKLTYSSADSIALTGAVRYVQSALDDIGHLFDPSKQETVQAVGVHVLCGEELLALSDVVLDQNWQPVCAEPQDLLRRLERATFERYEPEVAFDRQSNVRNHLGTQRVIEALAARPNGAEIADRLRGLRDEAVQQCREALRHKLDETQQLTEQAVCYDLITDEERARFMAAVEKSRILLSAIVDFTSEYRILEEINSVIAEKRQQRVQEVEHKLSGTTIPTDRSADLDVVRDALARGDFLSADEYIELIRKGQPLERASGHTRVVLHEFFPAFVQRFDFFMEDGRNRQDMRSVVDKIKEGGDKKDRCVGPIDMNGVPRPQSAEAAEMASAWLRLKNRSGEVATDLILLLRALGLSNVRVELDKSPRSPHWLAICECDPLRDPNVCIIPHFGSQAKGRYRILGLFDRPDEEAIVNLVKDTCGAEPALVLYFGRMTEQRRRDLAQLCWQRGRSFLTIDEAMIFFLCGERFGRLPILFQCALPFTVARPYTTTASLVPVEMFFGREQERRAVLDPYGTNLVYGGRQLGKSALLRDVERREHNPARGRVVRWIDLKNRGIGIDRPAEDLWAVLGQELHEENVLPRLATTHQTVAERIKEWLKGESDRRILLLLDEADAFLEADSLAVSEQTRHSFPEVARLKGLMDDTSRRFKVVFAGLHNVQRAARDPNTPVAHLGTPVCIGPLLDNGEWRQARDLIEIPFRHMGYDFQPSDLWMRVLSYTNYYPSLVQVFCKHLLEYLHNRDRTTFDFRFSPPYTVTTQQIEEVYQSEALQGEIRHKFELTLGLDERYRLIALCIALASIEEREDRALVDGFEVTWVRMQALSWWPQGFTLDTTYELFRTVLDEMIGLGILRRAGADRYALRSPNVLNLLGSKSQIEHKIMDVARLPAPPSYEAASFHRSINADCWTRSPLTAEQEAGLIDPSNGVAIIYGSQLSGLGHMHDALEMIPAQGGVRFATSVKHLRQLIDWLREVDKTRSESEGVTLAVVSHEARWSPAWVSAAADFLRPKISSKKRFLRTVFVADPSIAWEWFEEGAHSHLNLSELTLKPWREAALRRWTEDAELGPDAVSSCALILQKTGGWAMLVHALGEKCRGRPHDWRSQLDMIRLSWPNDIRWNGCCALPPAAVAVLEVMADWDGPIETADVETLVPGTSVLRVLSWAERLAYIREVEPDRWVLDPLVRAIVQARC